MKEKIIADEILTISLVKTKKWRIIIHGREKAFRSFENFYQAIEFAIVYAKTKNGILLIHREDGRIDYEFNYSRKQKAEGKQFENQI